MVLNSVKYTVKDKYAEIVFGHTKANSLTHVVLTNLISSIQKANKDSKVSSIILKSTGSKVFCAGASFDELLQVETPDESYNYFNKLSSLIKEMMTSRKPIIGIIEGKSIGGALGIIAACHLAIGFPTSSVQISELSLYIGPFVIEPILSHKIGIFNTQQLILQAYKSFSSEWAKNVGLFYEIIHNDEELNEIITQSVQLWDRVPEENIQQLIQIPYQKINLLINQLNKGTQKSSEWALRNKTQQKLSEFKNRNK